LEANMAADRRKTNTIARLSVRRRCLWKCSNWRDRRPALWP
jgi:hypothetical protein